ncbi:polysaccharide deacetylase family protein [Corynebacterium sp. P3-F1]|uniref:polysaccharide deacetylase family protein n=1 Tax=Corynebacterium sp. P3-F1 TaxID=3059080 RepID=UPI00265CFD33|nr:polysaccharide deacetylase family protein [Corynebacterium sp. P3-F1]WKK61604.1 polysaccharide deacetylase family protein [Corynebacterium sp. P3-F1]
MKRSLIASSLAVLTSALIANPATAAPLSSAPGPSLTPAPTALSSTAAQHLDSGIQSGMRQAYNALPTDVRKAIPDELRPFQHMPLPRTQPLPQTASMCFDTDGRKKKAPEAPPACTNTVAITYDDGPSPDTTTRLLDILKSKNIKATFFAIGGNSDAFPEILRRERDEGHLVANHSYNHPQLNAISDERISAELGETDKAIESALGTKPHWLRPPYGATDERVASIAGQHGLSLALWDVDTADWQNRNADITCRNAVDNATAGSIILMHDIHPSTVDATPCIIDGLREKGLRPVTLDELVQPVPGRTYTNAE